MVERGRRHVRPGGQADGLPLDAAAGDLFGRSVAIAGGTIVVRAYNTDTAYVFRTSDGGASAYGQVAKLDGSGGPVAIDGDTIVVGSNVFRTTDGWPRLSRHRRGRIAERAMLRVKRCLCHLR